MKIPTLHASHALAVGLDLGEWSTRDPYQAHIVMLEMHQRAFDMIGSEGTADAARFPTGAEHEVMDDQLAAPVEQIGERHVATERIEDIFLLDLHPRQGATFGA